jgi:hypothetical protein
MVIMDNNKAQRNLTTVLVSTGMSHGSPMRIRNADTTTRDMVISWNAPLRKGTLTKATIGIIGGESKAFLAADSIVLKEMKPGENRWLFFSFDAYDPADKTGVSIDFSEMNGNQAVNGCTFLIKQGTVNMVLRSILQFQLSVLYRLTRGFGHGVEEKLFTLTKRLLKERAPQSAYLKAIVGFYEGLSAVISKAFRDSPKQQRISFADELKILGSAGRGNLPGVIAAHGTLLNKMDMALTMMLVEEGDLACILSNIRFQVDLYSRVPKLKTLKSTPGMIKKATSFIERFSAGKLSNRNYPSIIRESMRCFRETVRSYHQPALKRAVGGIEHSLTSLQALQKAHYQYLLLLNK